MPSSSWELLASHGWTLSSGVGGGGSPWAQARVDTGYSVNPLCQHLSSPAFLHTVKDPVFPCAYFILCPALSASMSFSILREAGDTADLTQGCGKWPGLFLLCWKQSLATPVPSHLSQTHYPQYVGLLVFT